MSDNDDYEVGFGKPPKKSQFKPGQSGNARGRPKGKSNFHTLVQKALAERVAISENGKRKTITKAQVIAKQLTNKASAGDLRATQLVSEISQLIEVREAESNSKAALMTEVDQKVLEGMLRRHAAFLKGNENV